MKTLKTYFASRVAAGALALAAAMPGAAHAAIVALDEGFDDVGGLTAWSLVNNSAPSGSSWFQGNAGVFGAYAGAPNSYAAASFLGSSDPLGVVDNWLITPVLSLTGVTNLSFWTRGEAVPRFSDLLEVRFAPGASGSTTSFTTLLGTIGGSGGYPATWSEWSGSLNVEGEGRFAFRYVGAADSLNYIGLDSVRVVTAVPEPTTFAMLALGLGALGFLRRKSST